MLPFLQRVGRSLIVPFAVLPASALLMRLGAPDLLDIPLLTAAGSAIFDNLALLFAIGIAYGLSKDHRAEAVLATVVGYLILVGATKALLAAAPLLSDNLPNLGLAQWPIDLVIIIIVFLFIYYGLFYLLFRALDLKSPVRKDAHELSAEDMETVMLGTSASDDELTVLAKGYVNALGGAENIVNVDSCATRLWLTVNDSELVDSAQLQTLGAEGVVKPSPTAVQVVVGAEAESVAGAVRDVIRGGAAGPIEPHPGELTQYEEAHRGHSENRSSQAYDPAISASVNLMITALGGPQNILDASETATTRVRVVVEDEELVDENALRAAGASGVMALGNTYHILLGMQAQSYSEEMQLRLADAQETA